MEPFPKITVAELTAMLSEQPPDAEIVLHVLTADEMYHGKLTGSSGLSKKDRFFFLAAYLTTIDYSADLGD